MANIFEYTLSLKNQLSTKLQKIIGTSGVASKEFERLKSDATRVSSTFKSLGTSAFSLHQKIALLKSERDLIPIQNVEAIRKYNSEIKKLEKNVSKLETINGSKVKTWFSEAFGSLPAVATNPVVLMGAGMGVSIKKGMEAEMQKTNILTLLNGDAAKATELFDRLSNYAIKSPYDKAGLIDAQQTMMSFGLSADDSFGKLRQIGDIAMGDAQRMQSLSLAFAQSASAGRLNGQDLNQMINAGFNPLLVISEKTGESMASLKKRMGEGKVGMDEVSKAFEWATSEGGAFYGAAENASKTLSGRWSNMMESFSELALKVFEIIEPIINPLIGMITSVIEGFGNGMAWLVDKVKEGSPIILGIASAVGAFVTVLALHSLWTTLSAFATDKLTVAVLKNNLAFLVSPVAWWGYAIAAVIGVIMGLIYAFDGWGDTWRNLMVGMENIFKSWGNWFKMEWLVIEDFFLSGIDKVKEAWFKTQKLFGKKDAQDNLDKLRSDAQERAEAIKRQKELAGQYKKSATAAFNQVFGENGLHRNNKSFGSLKNDIVSKILPPNIPGAPTSPVNDDNNPTSKTNEAIATGGTRNTTVHLTIGNLVKDFKVTTSGITQTSEEVMDSIIEAVARGVSIGAALGAD